MRDGLLLLGAAALLLSGCTESPPISPARSLAASDAAPGPTPDERLFPPGAQLTMEACSELNVILYLVLGFTEFPPTIRPIQNQGLIPEITTILACDTINGLGLTESNSRTYFRLYPVYEIPEAKIEGAAGYLYLRDAAAGNSPLLRSTFGILADWENAPVEASFAPVGTMAEGRGSARIQNTMETITYETLMASPAVPGKGGVLGLYTVDGTSLRAHTVTFGDHRAYSDGAGLVYFSGGNGVPPVVHPRPAYHNAGFSLRFAFETIIAPAFP